VSYTTKLAREGRAWPIRKLWTAGVSPVAGCSLFPIKDGVFSTNDEGEVFAARGAVF
jgi:hypothetical protein